MLETFSGRAQFYGEPNGGWAVASEGSSCTDACKLFGLTCGILDFNVGFADSTTANDDRERKHADGTKLSMDDVLLNAANVAGRACTGSTTVRIFGDVKQFGTAGPGGICVKPNTDKTNRDQTSCSATASSAVSKEHQLCCCLYKQNAEQSCDPPGSKDKPDRIVGASQGPPDFDLVISARTQVRQVRFNPRLCLFSLPNDIEDGQPMSITDCDLGLVNLRQDVSENGKSSSTLGQPLSTRLAFDITSSELAFLTADAVVNKANNALTTLVQIYMGNHAGDDQADPLLAQNITLAKTDQLGTMPLTILGSAVPGAPYATIRGDALELRDENLLTVQTRRLAYSVRDFVTAQPLTEPAYAMLNPACAEFAGSSGLPDVTDGPAVAPQPGAPLEVFFAAEVDANDPSPEARLFTGLAAQLDTGSDGVLAAAVQKLLRAPYIAKGGKLFSLSSRGIIADALTLQLAIQVGNEEENDCRTKTYGIGAF